MKSGRKYVTITDKNITLVVNLSNLKIDPHYADQKVNNMIKKLAIVTLAVTAIGCFGPRNNTETGALQGAAIGGILGGIIGNQSGRAGEGAGIGAAAGAILGGAAGNAEDKKQGNK